MCADCHSTNLQKNYDAIADSYATGWSEISVGCEACHGPGSEHVRLAALGRGSEGLTVALDERRGAAWTIDTVTGNARRNPPRSTARELDVCAQCHSRRGQYSNTYRAGEPFLDHYRPALLESGLYHPDGQQREEVYDWGSFLSSRMHAAGVTCSDCHEPHAGRLRAPGNAVCGQCHAASKYEASDPSHARTRHAWQRVQGLSHADGNIHADRSAARPQLSDTSTRPECRSRRPERLQSVSRRSNPGMGGRSDSPASPAAEIGLPAFR